MALERQVFLSQVDELLDDLLSPYNELIDGADVAQPLPARMSLEQALTNERPGQVWQVPYMKDRPRHYAAWLQDHLATAFPSVEVAVSFRGQITVRIESTPERPNYPQETK